MPITLLIDTKGELECSENEYAWLAVRVYCNVILLSYEIRKELECKMWALCRAESGSTGSWKGSVEAILNSSSATLQRQVGDFHGLREKVIRLHGEFERLRKAGGRLPEHVSHALTHPIKPSIDAGR